MSALLEVQGLSVHYGVVHALTNVDLNVAEGEAVVVLGANGAGKSTLLRSLSHLVRRRCRRAAFAGEDLTHCAAHRIARLGLLHVPEGRQIFQRLTVTENLRLGALPTRGSRQAASAMDEVFVLFPRLAERRHQIGGTMSGGEQQMLAIGRALMGRPKLLMLDEPSMGLSPAMIDVIYDALEKIRGRTSLLVVEQSIHVALALASRVYLLRAGRVVHTGPADAITEDIVQAAYLGGEDVATSVAAREGRA